MIALLLGGDPEVPGEIQNPKVAKAELKRENAHINFNSNMTFVVIDTNSSGNKYRMAITARTTAANVAP